MTFLTAAKRHLLIALTMVVALSFSAQAHEGKHGYLGVMLQSISSSMAKALQLDEDQGVLINQVIEDGPADKAGLEDGDVILKFNDKTIGKHADLTKAVRSTSAGDVAQVEVMRGGSRKTLAVTMGENDENSFSYSFSHDNGPIQFFAEGDGETIVIDSDHSVRWIGQGGDDHRFGQFNGMSFEFKSDHGFMGVELEDISEQLGEFFGADDGNGALVSKVVEDSPAAKSGIKAGDIIVGLDDEEVESASDVFGFMASTDADDKIEVKVLRKGKKRSISVTLAEAPETNWAPENLHSLLSTRGLHKLRNNMSFPRHEVRIKAPRRHAKVMRLHGDDLSELKSELNELKKELRELQKELND